MTDPKTRIAELLDELDEEALGCSGILRDLRLAIHELGHGLQQATEAAREKQVLIIELRAEVARYKSQLKAIPTTHLWVPIAECGELADGEYVVRVDVLTVCVSEFVVTATRADGKFSIEIP